MTRAPTALIADDEPLLRDALALNATSTSTTSSPWDMPAPGATGDEA